MSQPIISQNQSPLTEGKFIEDVNKTVWYVGPIIGRGRFGTIVHACAALDSIKKNAPKPLVSVVKIANQKSGSKLMVEQNFVQSYCKTVEIQKWKQDEKIAHFGLPSFLGFGTYSDFHPNLIRYRFIVMPRYGQSVWDFFLANDRMIPEPMVYLIVKQIIDVLKYIHSKKYAHTDIKGKNLLFDLKNERHVYLVNFGAASMYTNQKKYVKNAYNYHRGTLEYTSRDAHNGVITMRGDVEILLYNVVQWLCDTLPWEKKLTDLSWVQQQKESAFKNTKQFLQECFKGSEIPTAVSEFMTLLDSMKYNDTPNYDNFREILDFQLQKGNQISTGKSEFVENRIEKPSLRKRTNVLSETSVSSKKPKPVTAAAVAVAVATNRPTSRLKIISPVNDSLEGSINSNEKEITSQVDLELVKSDNLLCAGIGDNKVTTSVRTHSSSAKACSEARNAVPPTEEIKINSKFIDGATLKSILNSIDLNSMYEAEIFIRKIGLNSFYVNENNQSIEPSVTTSEPNLLQGGPTEFVEKDVLWSNCRDISPVLDTVATLGETLDETCGSSTFGVPKETIDSVADATDTRLFPLVIIDNDGEPLNLGPLEEETGF